jgi:alkanesulfonate monooxygenase SsuD/methylene tetrahydromethanopterin reductase-like flavin-dependent oxidoreductase (luciferase family)
MRIGVARYMQNYSDLDHSGPEHDAHAAVIPDSEVYDEELALASLAEPLGFDSLWTTSHYFSPYQLTANALQQATFMAGRTSRVDFGTMVVVLPWHHPLHVATEISVLDNMLAGRRLILGLGRGAFRTEFEAFGIPIEESAARFRESVEIIRLAIERERFSYDGRFYNIRETSIRPRPRNRQQLLDDMRVVWGDSTTLPATVHLGLDVLASGSRRGSAYRLPLVRLNEIRAAKGFPPSRPVLTLFAACTRTDAEGRALMDRHLAEFTESSARLAGSPSMRSKFRSVVLRLARDAGFGTAVRMQLWGTPARCIARLRELYLAVRPREIVVGFRYGSMSRAAAEKSMRLFAEEVLPVVHSWPS